MIQILNNSSSHINTVLHIIKDFSSMKKIKIIWSYNFRPVLKVKNLIKFQYHSFLLQFFLFVGVEKENFMN